ncbi:MAG: hypothetical protein ACK6AD_02225 [Cyanobacteriota bacterium]|jgi:hypothetical protein
MPISTHVLLYWFSLPLVAVVLALLGILCLGGRFWGVAAALIGPLVALDGKVTSDAPAWVQAITLSFLLGVLAFLQLYGQTRSEQSRNAADAEIGCIAAEVRDIAAEVRGIAAGVGRQEERLGCVADAVGSVADEISSLRRSNP